MDSDSSIGFYLFGAGKITVDLGLGKNEAFLPEYYQNIEPYG